jgi:hypothetical protein
LKTIEEQLDRYGKCVVCGKYDFLDTNRSSPSVEKFCGTSCYLTWEYTPHPMFTEKEWWKFGSGIVSGRGMFKWLYGE